MVASSKTPCLQLVTFILCFMTSKRLPPKRHISSPFRNTVINISRQYIHNGQKETRISTKQETNWLDSRVSWVVGIRSDTGTITSFHHTNVCTEWELCQSMTLAVLGKNKYKHYKIHRISQWSIESVNDNTYNFFCQKYWVYIWVTGSE